MTIIGDGPCPKCREMGRDKTGNHLIHFSNGNKYCNRCGYKELQKEEEVELKSIEDIQKLRSLPIKTRGLDKDDVAFFEVKCAVDEYTGEVSEVYFPRHDKQTGKLIGYKGRCLKEKRFFCAAGTLKNSGLFGKQLYGDGGQLLIVTEGEFDAIAVRQGLRKKNKNYKVVSLQDGANSVDAFAQDLEWVSRFSTVILFFDNDEPGKEAAKKCAEMLPPGKVRIVQSTQKDANDCLLAGVDILQLISNAQEYKNETIISLRDAFIEAFVKEPKPRVPYPEGWTKLQQLTKGFALGEIDTWLSGTGGGKSTFSRELLFNIIKREEAEGNCAIISVEEDVDTIAFDLIGLHVGKRLRFQEEREKVDKALLKEAIRKIGNRVHLVRTENIPKNGGGAFDTLFEKIRYLKHYLDCNYFFIDHAHGIVLDFGSSGSTDDSGSIDSFMGQLNNAKKELNIHTTLIAHTRKTSNGTKSFEEGAIPTPDDVKGSGSIKQYSSSIFALSRNRLAEDEVVRNTTLITCWKSRFTGRTGHADKLFYNENGRMEPLNEEEEGSI